MRWVILWIGLLLSSIAFAVPAETYSSMSKDTSPAPKRFSSSPSPDDPLEPYNRAIFGFNHMLDTILFKPIATGYDKVLPDPVKNSVTNFFRNLDNVTIIFNDLLQFKFYQATSDLWRLGVNSTVGVLGLFDVASHMGLPHHNEDFGLTLAYWGYEKSSYFVLPVIGPRTLRDTAGLVVDYETYPVTYLRSVDLRNYLWALLFINRRAEFLPVDKIIEAGGFDRYTFVRNAYLQRRAELIRQNKQYGKAANPDSKNDNSVNNMNKKVAQSDDPTDTFISE